MLTTHHFNASLARGQWAEAQLDAFFRTLYAIFPATPEQQRRGIDRVFMALNPDAMRFGPNGTVEYKTDFRAGETGRIFIETTSVERGRVIERAGWAQTCSADMLIIWSPCHETAWAIQPAALKFAALNWAANLPHRTVSNDGYQSAGVAVPIERVAAIARAHYAIVPTEEIPS